jgi:hypothetical protein
MITITLDTETANEFAAALYRAADRAETARAESEAVALDALESIIRNAIDRLTGEPAMPHYISDKPRTRNNRAAYWVIVRNTYGEDRVVYRTNSHDDALCFMQEYCMGAGDYNVRVQDNVI